MVFMAWCGWRNLKTGKIKSGEDPPAGPDWVRHIANVDAHLNDDPDGPLVLPGPYKLKVLSLHQPYASLLFLTKRHETRGWAWPDKLIGEHIGIHATQKCAPVWGPLHDVCVFHFGADYGRTLPRQAILGTVVMDRTTPTVTACPESDEDVLAGDWTPGRWATHINRHQVWPQPIPAKGQQGFWTIDTDQLNASALTLEWKG